MLVSRDLVSAGPFPSLSTIDWVRHFTGTSGVMPVANYFALVIPQK
jgi:hypothetical protein